MSDEKSTWLPNLVGGVSIWKLGADLNQPRFFDGRLLEPEVEGADSLPTRVVWNVDRLVPLKDARASHPDDVRVAIEQFLGCVERVGKELASSTSGFRKFKDAFSVPALEGEGEASYFYDPAQKKLFVANWGASPRSIAGKGEVVFGYESFGALLAATRAGLGTAPGAPAAASGADGAAAPPPAPAPAPGEEKKPEDEKKKEEEKRDGEDKKRPVWVWILAVLVGIAIVVMLLFFLRACREREQAGGGDAGPDAALDAGADAADAADAGTSDAAADADGATDADVDAAADAGADAEADAAADAGADADAGGDAEADAESDAGDDGTGETPAGGDGEGPPAGGDGSGDGKIYIVPGGSGPGVGAPPANAAGIPYRSHFQPGAKSWRITKGAKYLNRSLKPRMNRGSFEVFLEPGASFSQVQVEWKDPSGKWHVH